MRGTASSAMAVIPAARNFSTSSGSRPGAMIEMRIAPRRIFAISSSVGALIFATTSEDQTVAASAMVTPAAAYALSGWSA